MVSNGSGKLNRGYSDKINHAFAFAAKHHDHPGDPSQQNQGVMGKLLSAVKAL